MASHGFCFVLVVLILQTCAVYVQGEIIKSSLTFVIDDTGSMSGEIRQVKEEVNIIFEKVLSSKASQIENFVIVTFNDPDAKVRTITKDRNVFKKALADITVHGGGDCPEYPMTGIELALKNSLPLSYLYVFTDASAKDYTKFDQIKSISQKKQSQVVFLLTGECDSTSDAEYQVYHQVAQATGGQVFHMMKDDVKDILKYIEESITGRGVQIVNKKYPPGTHKVKFNVDAYTGAVLISLTGLGSRIGTVTGPGGIKPPTEPIVFGKNKMAVSRLNNAKPGDYEVEIGGTGEVHIIMIAKSDLNFQLGFSIDSPSSMKDTVTRPPPEGNAFLGIRLLGEGIELTTAKIVDLDDHVIAELPLKLVNKKEQFYVTPSFNPPSDKMFLVTVIGKDLKTGTPVIRTGPTPIARQNPTAEPAVNTAPEVTIQNAPKIIVEYDAPLQLKCIVHGYPAPDIVWSERDTGITIPSKVHAVDVPYDSVSILDINKATKNVSYQCKASNRFGTVIKYIEVETKRKIYFNVIESPKDIRVEYTKEGSIFCKIDAYPPATIAWYKDGAEFSGHTNIYISGDKSILTIKNMQPELQGKYTCEAKNAVERKVYIANVAIFGVEEPVIDKSHGVIRVTEKTNAKLFCRMLKGIPKPAIRWSFKPAGTATFSVMTEATETLELKNVHKDQTGTYKCSARNYLGSDSFTMELVVEYPPKIKEDYKERKTKAIKAGDEVRIPCDVTGEPAPTVSWFFKGTRLASSSKIVISSDHSIKFKATPSDIGVYTCEAENKLATAKKTVSLDVLEAPVIDKALRVKHKIEKTNVAISCRILRGNPKPSIRWSFQPAGTLTFNVMTETTETVNLDNVRKDQTGTYKCSAQNTQGSDSFSMELVVEYPPIIKNDVTLIQIKDDDEVRISCDVTGEPAPAVRWFFNGSRFDSTAMARVSSDHSLRFKARLPDIGVYRCEAANKLGSAKKTTELQVYIPVTIETPKDLNIETMVGKSQILNCRADGYPEPLIKWTFQSSDPKIPAKDITPTGGVASLVLTNLQLDQQGLYTCEAENGIGGSASITYEVNVYAPPVIVNTYLYKNFEVMEGDVALRIQCKALGSPKPSIVWMKNGLNLAIGSEWYDMEDDGTLIIKNVDHESEGSYVCHAENKLGHVTERYEVTVRDNLVPVVPTRTIFVKEGETVNINCDIPHSKTDVMRWYKDGLAVVSGELTLYSVTRSEDGVYTCRVSNPTKSQSVSIKVVVGYKPEFITKEEEIVEFVHGADAVILSCEAYGEPTPTTATWKHNGNTLDFTDLAYPLGMVYGATGTYECEVSNAFGSITRSFKVTSRDCILDIKKDFPEKQPIMFSPSLTWPVFPVNDGYMIIRHRDYFYMNCPSQFSDPALPRKKLVAFCEGDNTIKIYGNIYNFADIQCKEEVKPEVSRSGIPCLPGKTEYVKVGYKVHNEFLGVFEVCLDTDNNVPLFTKHKLSPHHTDRSTEAAWSNSLLPQDFDTLYDCRRQTYDITSALGRGLSSHDSCCFGKRQLVSSHNLRPGVPISSAYDYLNVIPHWSTCNSKNWEDVEQNVRNLVKSAGRDLIISTGTANPRRGGASTDITLHDGRGGKQPVAPYLWKVVQDPAQSASLAIIQINIPELTAAEASKHVLCHDICGAGISWIEPSNWQNVEDGYTYCCSIIEFEKAFGFNGRFSPYMTYVLFDASLLPSSYMP